MKILPYIESDNIQRFYVENFDRAEQFEFLVAFVVRSMNGLIIEKLQAPDGAKICELTINKYPITFVYNDMAGTCFFSTDEHGKKTLQSIVQLLENTDLQTI